MNQRRKKVAVFIDYDNLNIGLQKSGMLFDFDILPEIVEQNGKVTLGRIYLTAGRESESKLYEAWKRGFKPIHVPSFQIGNGSKKSLADPQMICDIIEVLYTNPTIETYVIVSGDKDFIPVIRKIAELGKDFKVIGSGITAADALIEECTRLGSDFIDYSRLLKRGKKP